MTVQTPLANSEADVPLPGPFELIIILVIILLVFGVGKLPEVGGALGKGIREFKKNSDVKDAKDAEVSSATAQQTIDAPHATTVERTTVEPAEERPATKV